jgi:hypothetical protein
MQHSTNGVSINFFFFLFFFFSGVEGGQCSCLALQLDHSFFFFFKGDQVYVRFDWDCEGLK